MSDTQGIPVPGSNREPLAGAQYVSPVQHNDQVKVTLILRRRGGAPNCGRIATATRHSETVQTMGRLTEQTRTTLKLSSSSRTRTASLLSSAMKHHGVLCWRARRTAFRKHLK